jgi:integrase
MLLADLFSNYYRPLRLRGRSLNTTRLYGCTIRAYGKWLGYPPTTDDLSELMLSRYLEHRASIRSPYTAEKERSQLCSLARFAFERRIIETCPAVPPAPLPDRVPKAWDVAELQALNRAAAATRGYVGDIPCSVFFQALIATLWESAERIGAIMECTPDDFAPPFLTVRAEYRKGKKRDKVYRLSPHTCSLIAQIAGGRHLFAWTKNRTYLWGYFKDIVARAGLGRGRHLSFHQLRRSSASHYEARGGDASQLLDHSSRSITKRWYLDRRMTDRGPAPCDILPSIKTQPPQPEGDG